MSGVSDQLVMESVIFQCCLAILASSCRPAFHIASCQEFRFWFLIAELSPTLRFWFLIAELSIALHILFPPPLSLSLLPSPTLVRRGPLLPGSVGRGKGKKRGDREVGRVNIFRAGQPLTFVQIMHYTTLGAQSPQCHQVLHSY